MSNANIEWQTEPCKVNDEVALAVQLVTFQKRDGTEGAALEIAKLLRAQGWAGGEGGWRPSWPPGQKFPERFSLRRVTTTELADALELLAKNLRDRTRAAKTGPQEPQEPEVRVEKVL